MYPEKTTKGLFITLEGGEGAGKSSLIQHLDNKLRANVPDRDVVITREPGSSSIGGTVRHLLLEGSALSPRTEALLFAAERAQHMEEIIMPALKAGNIVLCDRFITSSIAYQGIARGLGAEDIASLSDFAVAGRYPDAVLILDIDPQVGLLRKEQQKELNNMELEGLDFHRAVREAFRNLSSQAGHFLIDANRSPGEVAADTWRILGDCFPNIFRGTPVDKP